MRRRLRGLRFHQWMNIADMKFYQLKAEVADVEPGSWFVSLLCCRHSWDPEPSSDEPSALIATTSIETPKHVQALPKHLQTTTKHVKALRIPGVSLVTSIKEPVLRFFGSQVSGS